MWLVTLSSRVTDPDVSKEQSSSSTVEESYNNPLNTSVEFFETSVISNPVTQRSNAGQPNCQPCNNQGVR